MKSGPGPSNWTGFLLHQAHKIASEIYASELRKLELRPVHVGILQLLHAEGRRVQARLAAALSVDKASITNALCELERAGHVLRVMHPDDERAYLVSITVEGLNALERAEELNRKVSEQLFGTLSPEERVLLHNLLEKLCAGYAK